MMLISKPNPGGQRRIILDALRARPVVSFELTSEMAIPEAAARVCELRAMGYNIKTTLGEFVFRGKLRKNVATYHLGAPEWPAPGYLEGLQ